jgi:hypothetical protein
LTAKATLEKNSEHVTAKVNRAIQVFSKRFIMFASPAGALTIPNIIPIAPECELNVEIYHKPLTIRGFLEVDNTASRRV